LRQFELRWANLPEPVGRRPVLLLSRPAAYAYLSRIIVAEVTTTVRNIPQEVPLGAHEGLRARSVANFDNVHVVPASSIGPRIGALARSRELEAKRALGFALGWPELMGIE
jgi:mRNA interferase MazF